MRLKKVFVDRTKQTALARATGIVLGISLGMAIAIYSFWYASAGRFPTFPPVNNEDVELGESFLRGQLSLPEKPDPRLIALPNPYDFYQRGTIPYHWDASYYQGKYYLYWGPVPALDFAVIEGLTHVLASPSFMVAGAYIKLLIIVLIILFLISNRFFNHGPGLSNILFVLMGFVNLPILFLLGRPQIYETSIIFGQLYLLFGLLGWIIYTDARARGWLLVTGLCWGLAIGCRYNLVISVVIYVTFALLWISRENGWHQSLEKAGLLIGPLALCLIGLGTYDILRFGNAFETGQKYQLTIPELHQLYFSLAYLPSKLYIYLLYPIALTGKFPFIKSELFSTALLPNWLSLPTGSVFDHVVLGAIISAPCLWLLALSIPLSAWMIRQIGNGQISSPKENFFLGMIFSAAAGQFLFLLLFFYGAERYVADFYLPLILVVAMLVRQMDQRLLMAPGLRIVLWLIVTALTLCTAGMGFFGGFGIPPKLFRSFNPRLYTQLASY